jgi:hypothetical protein
VSRTEPLIPNRWSREVGAAFCYAALYCAVRGAPDGTDNVSVGALIFAALAAVLLYSGIRLAGRDRW